MQLAMAWSAWGECWAGSGPAAADVNPMPLEATNSGKSSVIAESNWKNVGGTINKTNCSTLYQTCIEIVWK